MESTYKKEAKLIKRLGVTVHVGGCLLHHTLPLTSAWAVGRGGTKFLGWCRVGVSWQRHSIQWAQGLGQERGRCQALRTGVAELNSALAGGSGWFEFYFQFHSKSFQDETHLTVRSLSQILSKPVLAPHLLRPGCLT